jgi:hypothetical protein
MVDCPKAAPVAIPVFNPIVETPVPTRSTEVQFEAAVLSMVDPSLNVSIAVNFWVPPATAMVAVAGFTENDFEVAALTVNVADAVCAPNVAVMVAVPTTAPVASPPVAPFDESVATAAPPKGTLTEVQLEATVLSNVVPSLKVSVATNCCEPPTGVVVVSGVTLNDLVIAAFTVKMADEDCAPKVAVIAAVPVAAPVASPPLAPFAESVATAVPPEGTLTDVQLEAAVLSKVDPSLNVSIAAYC